MRLVTIVKAILVFCLVESFIMIGLIFYPFGLSGAYYRKSAAYFGKAILFASGGKPSFSGLENLDPSKSYVFLGNHQSYLDIFLIQVALLSVKMTTLFMAKEELYSIPFFKFMTKHMHLIPVSRDNSIKALSSVIDAIKTISDGHSITIYVEGTRSENEKLLPFKRGGFILAEKANKEIVPFCITGTSKIMPKKGFIIRSGPCHITFLPPIDPKGSTSKELLKKIEAIISEQYKKDKAENDKLWQM